MLELGGPGGPGGPLPPIFDRSVNPIPTGEGRLTPAITTGTPKVFHLPASLVWDHPLKMSAFFSGGGVKYWPNLPTDSSKSLPMGGVKKKSQTRN